MGAVLITGGVGFLGKHLARSLAEAGDTAIITYRRSFRTPELLADIMDSHVKAVRCDVLDFPELTRVIRDYGVDSVIHMAHLSNYEAPIYSCLQTNVMGTINLLEAAAIGAVKKVTYISSSSITSHGPGESSALEAETVPIISPATGVVPPSKKVGEILVTYYGATFGFPVAIVRPGMFYGPYGESEIGSAKVLKDILEGALAGKPVNLPETSLKQPVNLVYVRDVAAGIALVHRAAQNQHRVYCIDGERPSNWEEIAEIIAKHIPNAKITFGGTNQGLGARSLPDNLNLATEFRFRPQYGMKEGLLELIEWYQKGRV